MKQLISPRLRAMAKFTFDSLSLELLLEVFVFLQDIQQGEGGYPREAHVPVDVDFVVERPVDQTRGLVSPSMLYRPGGDCDQKEKDVTA